MNRRFRTAAALTFLALGAGVATAGTAEAAPAPAPGYTWHAEYFYQDQCSTQGRLGETNGQWTAFYCTWTPFNPGFTGSGILGTADLYVN